MKTGKNKPMKITEKHQPTKNNVPQLDLTKPEDCKTFLNSISVDGKKASGFQLANGAWLEFKDMTDEQLIHYANEWYLDVLKKKDGDIVNTEMYTGAH